jgi:hypothetical protein
MRRLVPILSLLALVLGLLTAQAAPAGAATDYILCDGQTFSDWTKPVFVLDGGVYADITRRKVIRNCSFRDSAHDAPAISIRNARNVLIERSTFENIRSGRTGDGTHAIAIPGGAGR